MSLDLETIGVAFDTSGLEKGTRAFADNEKAANKTADAADALGGRFGSLGRAADGAATAAKSLAAVFAAYKIIDHIRDVTMLSARYETMGVVMRVAGNNAG